jgi:hypothetical protein
MLGTFLGGRGGLLLQQLSGVGEDMTLLGELLPFEL